MEGGHKVIPPGSVFLPAQPHISKILLPVQGACFQTDGGNNGLECRARAPGLTKTVQQRFPFILIECVPPGIGQSQDKVIAVKGGCADQRQHLSRVRVHRGGAAGIFPELLVQSVLKLRVDGQPDILSVLYRKISQHGFFAAVPAFYINAAAVPALQFLFKQPFQAASSDHAVFVVPFARVLLQILGGDISHIAGQVSRRCPKWIAPHLHVADHDPRNGKQRILPRFFRKHLFLRLQRHQIQLADFRDGFDGDKGILLHPGRVQAVLNRFLVHVQQLG